MAGQRSIFRAEQGGAPAPWSERLLPRRVGGHGSQSVVGSRSLSATVELSATDSDLTPGSTLNIQMIDCDDSDVKGR